MALFRMPSLGADMDSGVLLEWLVQPGQAVHRGDVVAVVDTAKAAVEVECFDSGTVDRLLVEPGTRVPVGTPLAAIAPAADSVPTSPPAPPPAAPPLAAAPALVQALSAPAVAPGESPVTSPLVRHLAEQRHVDLHRVHGTGVGGRVTRADVDHAALTEPPGPPPPQPAPPRRPRASPLARRLAAELDVDLAQVRGTGRDGAVEARDVREAAARSGAPPAPPAAARTAPAVPPSAAEAAGVDQRADAMRAAIAALMARSKREIPHYYLSETVDLSAAVDWLHERNRELPVSRRLVLAALLLKATARAAAAVPQLNGFWIGDRFVPGTGIHLGVAVALRGGGLVAPAIHDADRRGLADLMAALRDLVARTRTGRLRGAEMTDPTITVSNLGEQGVESILGVIYPPQVALVGFGRIVDRVCAVNGLIGVRPAVTVSLAADHRATDGATGARFLNALAKALQKPEEL